ncbi:MAG: hypothetical protein ACTSV5_13815 [Promethearchaeota archaeon]
MMPIYYHCPCCQSFQVKEREKSIFCPICKLNFDKKFLQILKDEDILANEELKGIIDVFADDNDDNGDLTLIP